MIFGLSKKEREDAQQKRLTKIKQAIISDNSSIRALTSKDRLTAAAIKAAVTTNTIDKLSSDFQIIAQNIQKSILQYIANGSQEFIMNNGLRNMTENIEENMKKPSKEQTPEFKAMVNKIDAFKLDAKFKKNKNPEQLAKSFIAQGTSQKVINLMQNEKGQQCMNNALNQANNKSKNCNNLVTQANIPISSEILDAVLRRAKINSNEPLFPTSGAKPKDKRDHVVGV